MQRRKYFTFSSKNLNCSPCCCNTGSISVKSNKLSSPFVTHTALRCFSFFKPTSGSKMPWWVEQSNLTLTWIASGHSSVASWRASMGSIRSTVRVQQAWMHQWFWSRCVWINANWKNPNWICLQQKQGSVNEGLSHSPPFGRKYFWVSKAVCAQATFRSIGSQWIFTKG